MIIFLFLRSYLVSSFLYYICFILFYFRHPIIPRHRHINRIIIRMDILQFLFLFQPFDVPCGGGGSETAEPLKVGAG